MYPAGGPGMNPASEGLGLESQPAETKADRVNIASNTDFLIAILLIGLKDCPLRYGADFLEEAKPTSSRTFFVHQNFRRLLLSVAKYPRTSHGVAWAGEFESEGSKK